jgi:hypothetical protein
MLGGGVKEKVLAATGNMGADVVSGFEDGTDRIVVSGLGYGAVNIGTTIIISGGANALISFSSGLLSGSTLTLTGVNQANVTAADFVFA